MTDLMKALTAACHDLSQDQQVALLLSGGVDSISVGMALEAAGKTIHAYTIQLAGCSSSDLRGAQLVAHHSGWPLSTITVPKTQLADDFIRLAVHHACQRKVQFECCFPLMYAFSAINETEIFSGFNADDHYGNTREAILEHDRMKRAGFDATARQTWFDTYRKRQLNRVRDLSSGDTWGFAQRFASGVGKRFYDPYLDDHIVEFFSSFSHEELASPKKHIVRQALGNRISELRGTIKSGITLQKGTGVSDTFKALLTDPRINRFERTYTSVSSLCQRWAKEVAADANRFWQEAASLSDFSHATVRRTQLCTYSPKSMSDVHNASAAERFTVASMFAGGGGSSLGYRLAGGKVRVANEFVPEAAKTYSANFPDTPVDQHDIRRILARREIFENLIALAGLTVGDLDILDGSPPCSEFSISGRGISDQSVPKPYSDVAQRGIATLPFDFVEFAHALKPKVVIMENVPTLATRAAAVLERLEDALRFAHGARAYFVAHAVLNSADFGVPQKRRRLFVMGIRADVGARIRVTEDNDVLQLYPEPSHAPVTVRDALADLKQSDQDTWPWKRIAMTTDLGRVIRLLPKSPSRLTRLVDVDPTIEGNFTLTRCSWDLPTPTFTVVGAGPNGLSGAIHPDQDRKFTLPELKRLTSVPDDYILTGTLAQAAERICRMVPPPLTQAIAESLYQKVFLPMREARHDD